MKLSSLEQKILMNIQLGVICVDMVDYCISGKLVWYIAQLHE